MSEFEKVLNDKVFLILSLRNPKHALSAYRPIKMDENELKELEILANSELQHWKTTLAKWNNARTKHNANDKFDNMTILSNEQSYIYQY